MVRNSSGRTSYSSDTSKTVNPGSVETVKRIADVLAFYSLPTLCPNTPDELLDVMLSDKKAEGSRINLILPKNIGECIIHPIPTSELGKWLEESVG